MKLTHATPILLFAALSASCTGGFPTLGARKSIALARVAGDPGSPAKRLPIVFSNGPTFTYDLEVHDASGAVDASFDGWVRLSAAPGTIVPLQRNVHVVGGVAKAVPVTLVAAFGDTRIWAEDLGYAPTAPDNPAPQCANGLDDDGDGLIDFPADPGCFAPNDDDERAGTIATGAGDVLYFASPRIADVRGVAENGGTATAFPRDQVRVDTGYHADTGTYDFDVVVTRIASDGFYVTDVQDQNARGYASIFAFTFSPPQKLAICDRLRSLSGTSSDFYGFTEMNFPTWSVEYYDPSAPARPCLVPEPRVLAASELPPVATNLSTLFRYESALVRVQTGGSVTVRVGKHFGAGKVPLMGAAYVPQDDASSCDFNQNGKVDFSSPDEAACSKACTADVECTEFANFLTQSSFTLVVANSMTMQTAKAQADASASPGFDPVLYKGKTLGAFTGTLRYFSGGQQFTIEARCGDDIVLDPMKQPLASDKACIRPRTDLNPNDTSH